MTAYARVIQETSLGELAWELRVVNHRYRDISLRLPEPLRYLEPDVRQLLSEHVQRGKLDATLKYKPNDAGVAPLSINNQHTQQLCQLARGLMDELPSASLNVVDLLAWPGVLSSEGVQQEGLSEAVLSALQQAIEVLLAQRAEEGGKIADCLTGIVQRLDEHLLVIQTRYDAVVDALKDKLQQRLQALALEINQDRFEQEMLYWLNKMDIAEEVQRFQSHLGAIGAMLKGGGVLGRKLDFYLQELNREANTMGSKLQDTEVGANIVDIKVGIEQMREQAQNIE